MDKEFKGSQKIRRKTVQKRAVMEVLKAAKRHLTADEVYEVVRKRVPHISLGTVYRNLEMLVETGQATKVDLGEGKSRFDSRTDRHHHFRCTHCGRIYDVPFFHLDDVASEVMKEAAFKATDIQVILEGICERCLKKEKGGPNMTEKELDGTQKNVLKALAQLDKPAGNKEIAQTAGLDSKEVTKAIKVLKTKGLVNSPVRCKYAVTPAGKSEI